MGESAPGRVRLGEMSEVVFSGTHSRPPRNLVEVRLTLATSPEAMGNLTASVDGTPTTAEIPATGNPTASVDGNPANAPSATGAGEASPSTLPNEASDATSLKTPTTLEPADGTPATEVSTTGIATDAISTTGNPANETSAMGGGKIETGGGEIEICRKLERGGVSKWSINGKTARAIDVAMLLADGAIGARSAAIIGQGEVGGIIRANPIERRKLLEEAAGISGIRTRRTEAASKLKASQTNLERVTDIQTSLAEQHSTLKRQARQAERYKLLGEQIAKIKAHQLWHNWQSALEDQTTARSQLADAVTTKTKAERALGEADQAQTQKSELVAESAKKVATAQTEVSQSQNALANLKRAQESWQARLKDAQSRLKEWQQDTQNAEQTIANATSALEEIKAKQPEANDKGTKDKGAKDKGANDKGTKDTGAKDTEAELKAVREELAQVRAVLAQKQAAQAELMAKRLRADQARSTIADHHRTIKELKARLKGKGDGTSQAATQAKEQVATAQQQLAEARAQTATALEVVHKTESVLPKETLPKGLRVQQGLENAVIAALAASDFPEPFGWHRPQPAPPKWEEVGTQLATQLEQELAREIGKQTAKQNAEQKSEQNGEQGEKGRAKQVAKITIQPLTDVITEAPEAMQTSLAYCGLISFAGISGGSSVVGSTESASLSDSPSGSPSVSQADFAKQTSTEESSPLDLSKLVARLVPKLELKIGGRLVSQQGGLWRWDGYSAPPLNRQSLAEAKSHLSQAQATENRLQQQYQEARTRHQQLEQTLAQEAAVATRIGEEIQSLEAKIKQLSSHLTTEPSAPENIPENPQGENAADNTSQIPHTKADGNLPASTGDTASSENPPTENTQGDITQGESTQGDLTQRNIYKSESEEELLARQARLMAKVERLTQQDTDLKARQKELEADRTRWQSTLADARHQLENLAQRKHQAQELLAARKTTEAGYQKRLEAAQRHLTNANGELKTANATHQLRGDELHKENQTHRQATSDLSQAEQTWARLEEVAKTAEATVARNYQELLAQHPQDPETLPASYGFSKQEPPPLEKLEGLVRQYQAMGEVNLRAGEDFKQLDARMVALANEAAEITTAITKLQRALTSLKTEESKKMSLAAGKVNASFKRLFQQLFAGGTAAIQETDDGEGTKGLEVMVRLPQRKSQRLSVLSGGEQALVALALAFALFEANPAPVCVLDEVDAPLDDANAAKFCQLLREVSNQNNTPMVVVTHRPLTMSEMNRLQGVTMAEKGVSELVSVDLTQALEFAA